jgi:pimeloyl-ACP methyl ester carboxylesterase
VLITHGGNDAIVKPEAAEQHKAGLARVDVQIMPGIGHAPFWENAAAFNQRLRAFVETCQGA